jgi:hypothetical protein
MEHTVYTSAEKEIALRGHIIEALVSENALLKEKLQLLASAIGAKQAAYSLSELEMLEKLTGIGISEKGNGTTEARNGVSGKGNASPQLYHAISEKRKGITGSKSSISEGGPARLLMSLSTKWMIVKKDYGRPALTKRVLP